MIGNDSDTNSSPSQNNNTPSYNEYLARAKQACSTGDVVLGLHLYLAAYERSLQEDSTPNALVLEGLRQAWVLACQHKERSLAEYIFEKIEPYLTSEEITQYATQLQQLALDKLEEFGLTREDLEGMGDMLSQDLMGLDHANLLMRFEQGAPTSSMLDAFQKGLTRDHSSEDENGSPKPSSQKENSTPQGQGDVGEEEASSEPSTSLVPPSSEKDAKATPEVNLPALDGLLLPSFAPSKKEEEKKPAEQLRYRDLVGYDKSIQDMHDYGIGMEDDPAFKELIQTLNKHHGLSRMPVTDSFLFCSESREDAYHFMLASMGEVGLPAIRMRMEENLQGMPVLCVMASADNQPRMNMARNAIEGGGVLVLEDLDLWSAPLTDFGAEEMGGFVYSQLSRGAREAINLIHSAVENPDVYVFASVGQGASVDPFFHDLLAPMTVIDINEPSAAERAEVWSNISKEHPSLKKIDRALLVQYSAGMSRFDIYLAAREAVEEAYKESLHAKKYIPVKSENLFEKIAAYQPLESTAYQQIEDNLVDVFREDMAKWDEVPGSVSE